MIDWLNRITETCFFASYALAWALELLRILFLRTTRFWSLVVGLTVAGCFAQTLFLWSRATTELSQGTVFASWADWMVIASWVIALAYLILAVRRPRNGMGLFMLPLPLVFISLALLQGNLQTFPRGDAAGIWGRIHGSLLLAGTVAAMLGFSGGVMYLVQSYRLKRKWSPQSGLQLPSLEWLQRVSRETSYVSSGLLLLGLFAGVIVKLNQPVAMVAWTDPLVLWSAVLFLWLASVSLFEWRYRPARKGHKVIYLTIASGALLGVSLLIIFFSGHAGAPPANQTVRATDTMPPPIDALR